jgi:hypothetical protein
MQLTKYILALGWIPALALWLWTGHVALSEHHWRTVALEQRQIAANGNCGERERMWAELLNQETATNIQKHWGPNTVNRP